MVDAIIHGIGMSNSKAFVEFVVRYEGVITVGSSSAEDLLAKSNAVSFPLFDWMVYKADSRGPSDSVIESLGLAFPRSWSWTVPSLGPLAINQVAASTGLFTIPDSRFPVTRGC
jgi:hypothetical protein